MSHRQPRTYPFLGIFLANLLTNAVLGKLAPLSASPYTYNAEPWLAYNRPSHYEEYYQQEHYAPVPQIPQIPQIPPIAPVAPVAPIAPSAYWSPIPAPYTYSPPPLHTTISITTPSPLSQQQIISPNSYIPDYYSDYIEDTAETNEQPQPKIHIDEDIYPDNIVAASNKSYSVIEPIASDTTLNVKRQIPDKSTTKSLVKRATYGPRYSNRAPQNRVTRVRYKRYKTGQQRKRYTTTPSYYDDDDDSYEDYTTTRYRPRKKYRPTYGYRRTTTEIYDDYDEDSFEATTRPYRRRKPTKIKNKRRPVYDDDYSYDNSYEYDGRNPFTETVTFRQRQGNRPTTTTTQQTTTETTTMPTTTTTEEASTPTSAPENTTTNGTTLYPGEPKDNVSITITRPGSDYVYPTFTGYGPSNGNENISITYGPPTKLEYAAPYVNWYAQQPRPNEIVGRVHDIVGFNNRELFRRRLT